MAKELTEAMSKEPKETMRMISYQIKNTNKDISVLKTKKTNRDAGVEKYNKRNEKFTRGDQ